MKKQEIETVGKTESFWSRHVRLIAFLVAVGAFLVVFVPLGMIGIGTVTDHLEACRRSDSSVPMRVEDLRAVAQKGVALSIRDLEDFEGERDAGEQEGMHFVMFRIDIEDRYFLMASFNETTGTVYYLTVTDFETGTELDLLADGADIDAFLGADAK